MSSVSFNLPSTQDSWSFSPKRGVAVSSQGLGNNAATVAADIARRIEGQAMPEAVNKQTSAGVAADDKIIDLKALEQALEGFFNNIIENFGVDAGAVSQALVYKRIGEEEITEDVLANGLLDAMKFIDKQFGAAAGDELIAFVNNDLNKQLNAYFDNGKNEEFLVSGNGETGPAAAAGAVAAAVGEFMEARGGELAGEGVMSMLKRMAKELEEELQRKLQGSLADLSEPGLAKELAAYAEQAAPAELASGLILDKAV